MKKQNRIMPSIYKQICLILICMNMACSKEEKFVDPRNITKINDNWKSYIPSKDQEYAEFRQDGNTVGGFYFHITSLLRKDTNCTNGANCVYYETMTNRFTQPHVKNIVSLSASSLDNQPHIDVQILDAINKSRIVLKSDFSDYDSVATVNNLTQFLKIKNLTVQGRQYENVLFIAARNWEYSFYYTKEYGVIKFEYQNLTYELKK